MGRWKSLAGEGNDSSSKWVIYGWSRESETLGQKEKVGQTEPRNLSH